MPKRPTGPGGADGSKHPRQAGRGGEGRGTTPLFPGSKAPRAAWEPFPAWLLAAGLLAARRTAGTAGRAQICRRLPPAPRSWQGWRGVLLPGAGLGTPRCWGTSAIARRGTASDTPATLSPPASVRVKSGHPSGSVGTLWPFSRALWKRVGCNAQRLGQKRVYRGGKDPFPQCCGAETPRGSAPRGAFPTGSGAIRLIMGRGSGWAQHHSLAAEGQDPAHHIPVPLPHAWLGGRGGVLGVGQCGTVAPAQSCPGGHPKTGGCSPDPQPGCGCMG